MRQLLSISCYETFHIFRNKILFLMVFVIPLLYTLLFGLVYSAAVLTDIPLGIVDLDDSPLSRDIVTAFKNSPNFKTVDGITTYQQLEKAMNDGTVRAGVVIPEDFASKASQYRQTPVLTVYDASNLIWGFNIRKYTLQVISNFSAENTASYLAGLGYTEQEIKNVLSTVSADIQVWYNPTYSYATFLFPGLLLMVVHQIGLLSISLSVIRDKENKSWVHYLCSPLPKWKIFVGKSLPYFTANLCSYVLLLWVAAQFINVKIAGSPSLLLLFGVLYTVIITSLGFFISTKVPNSLQATRYIMLLSVPFFMISGFTWPQTHIPAVLNYLAHLLPYTWMAEAYRMIAVKELGISHLLPHISVLIAMAVISVMLALSFKKHRIPPKETALTVNCELDYPKRVGH